MSPILRHSTKSKTDASAKAANHAGFKPRPRKPLTRKQRYTCNKGLVSLKAPKALEGITISNAADSPLLRLPPEIRNMIFSYAVALNSPGGVALQLFYKNNNWDRSDTSIRMYRSMANRLAICLPQVCRQVYAETATLVYAENTFSFTTGKRLKIWLSRRLIAQRDAIRHLALPYLSLENKNGLKNEVTEMCPNLECFRSSEVLDDT